MMTEAKKGVFMIKMLNRLLLGVLIIFSPMTFAHYHGHGYHRGWHHGYGHYRPIHHNHRWYGYYRPIGYPYRVGWYPAAYPAVYPGWGYSGYPGWGYPARGWFPGFGLLGLGLFGVGFHHGWGWHHW